MKKTLFFLFFIFSFSFSKAQWVFIPDLNFVAWLQTNYPSCMNGNLMDTTCNGIVNATTVNCSNQNISDLDGVQYFDNLHFLYCDHNQLATLPNLPSSLTWLKGSYNVLTFLPPLPSTLTHLECPFNQLTYLPTLPLTLTYLDMGGNQISILPTLPNSLTVIYFNSNLLTSLPLLPPSLNTLYCGTNQIISLPNLPNSIVNLICGGNPITILPSLPSSLNSLWCNQSQLSTLPTLPSGTEYVFCGDNNLTSLPSLPNSIITLDCSNNLLTSLPVLPSSLFNLNCSGNQIINLPLLPNGIDQLYCSNGVLQTVTNLPGSLTKINLYDNPDLACLPQLPSTLNTFEFYNTSINCLPNIPNASFSLPLVSSLPLCDVFNSNGCPIFWNISGTIYHDTSFNCLHELSESLVPNVKLNLYQSGNLIQQQYYSGVYSFNTDLSTYKVEADTSNLPFYVSCPSTGDSIVNVTAIDSLVDNVNFGLQCKPGFDIGTWDIHHLDFFFPGNATEIIISAGDAIQGLYNVSCNNSSLQGEVKVVINGLADYLSTLSGALTPTVIADTLIYTIANFSLVNSTTDFAFIVITDTTAQTGDEICFDVTVTPTAGDNNISNNTLTHCFAVSNSFDPNEKEVSPIGSLTYPFNDWLTYTIHFQNTGTAAAQHIQVLDTLDASIDASTFQLLSYSFAPLVQITGSDIAFDFININLPDSTTDLAASQGYVSYRVMPMANLPMGTAIENTASIYFDFNTPVVTNTVSNLICNPTTSTTSATICQGDTYFFEGSTLTVAGNYSVTLQSIAGCDSTINLNLFVDPVISNSISASICSGITFDFNGQQLSAPGNYADTLIAITGCDSIVNLSLTVLNPISISINQTICFGDSINFNGNYFDTTGIFSDTLSNSNGCDSIVNLSLTVLAPATSSFSETICIGETYLFNGINESATGIYFDTLNAGNNCDSIISLHLTVNNPNATIQLNGNTLTATGAGVIQWINCDSGTFVPGIIGGTFTPTVIGHYAAWVWDGLCSDTTNCIEVLLDGIGQLTAGGLHFAVFPNPVDENMTIQLSQLCENCSIEITNTLGQILFSEIIKDKVESINLADLTAGIYFVKLKNESGNFAIRKIIKN